MFLFPFEVFWVSFPFLLFLKTLELNWKTSASCAAETRNTRWPLCLVRPEKSNAIKSTNSSAASSAGSVLTDSDTEGLIALHLYYRGCRWLLFFTLWMSGVIWLQGNDFGWRIWSNYYSEKKHYSCKWGRNVSRKSLIYHSVLLQWCNNPSS